MTYTPSAARASSTVRDLSEFIRQLPDDVRISVMILPVAGDTATVDKVAKWLGVSAESISDTSAGPLRRARATFGNVEITAVTQLRETPRQRRERLARELAKLDAVIAGTAEHEA